MVKNGHSESVGQAKATRRQRGALTFSEDRLSTVNYGDRFAADYDEVYADFPPDHGQIEFLRERANGGAAIELGAGTGRIAIPLASAGVPVLGLDYSAAMLDRLAQRSKALPVETLVGDAASFACPQRKFNLAYGIFNFLFLLPTRDAQLQCFRCVRSVLNAGGKFVVEAFVPIPDSYLPDGPQPGFFPDRTGVSVRSISPKKLSLFASSNDATRKIWRIQEVLFSDEGFKLLPYDMHYMTAEEMDELAAQAEFTLVERFEAWNGSSFSAESRKHISVYQPRSIL